MCGILYLPDIAPQSELDEFYRQKPYRKRAQFDWIRSTKAIEFMHRNRVRPKSVLDIGCGQGLLPSMLDAETKVGVDLNPKRQEACLIPVQTEVPEREFGLVILSHILEHVEDPHHLMDVFVRRIESGGYGYIEVPILDDAEECSVPIFAPDHTFYFSFASLVNYVTKRHRSRLWVVDCERELLEGRIYPEGPEVGSTSIARLLLQKR